ncbi:hypothetical protein LTS17_010582 [Exophiala oligosperma]
MPRETPHPQTIFHLVPNEHSPRAQQMLLHPDNEPFVSLCQADNPGEEDAYGLEIGYHVSARPRALVIVEVGKNADLIMTGPNISQIHFSFEIHPESRQIMFLDRSRLHSTKIEPLGFRVDGNFRQIVLVPDTTYTISAGGANVDQFVFDIRGFKKKDVFQEVEKKSQMVDLRGQNPRWARTVDDAPTDLPTWYITRLHTPIIGAVQRTIDVKELGRGAFGQVWKAVDCDSGCFIAVKHIELAPELGLRYRTMRFYCDVKSKFFPAFPTYKNIVDYLGSSGWNTGIVNIYMSLKPGNLCDLVKRTPSIRSDDDVINRLWHEMLMALDYLAFRGWIQRDVKLENDLYTPSGDDNYLFQLADFGLASQQHLAKTYCGSPLYMAPEMMYGTRQQSPKVDVWSLFVVIVILARGEVFTQS